MCSDLIACSDSDIDAAESATSLRARIEQAVEDSSDLPTRLNQLQLPPYDSLPDGLIEQFELNSLPQSGDATPTRASSPPSVTPADESIPEAKSSAEPTFEVVLSSCRVYSRVEDRAIHATSVGSTSGSRA